MMSNSAAAQNNANANGTKKNWDVWPKRSVSQSSLRPSQQNKLHQAIAARDLTKFKARLSQNRKAKVELTEFDQMEQTPLMAALRYNLVDFVKELLEFYKQVKAEINQRDKTGDSALHIAAGHCDDVILMQLLNYDGIDVNLANGDQNTPLHFFCAKFKSPNCQEPFQLFLKRGVNINAHNKFGETPLHKSIFNNSVRLMMVNLLLEAGADLTPLSASGQNCLHFAVYLGREDLVSVLVKAGADITARNTQEKKTSYEVALTMGNAKVINVLREVQDIYDWLKSLGLEMYWKVFVREEISKDILPELTEQVLDKMGITAVGHRMKILRSCSQIKLSTETSSSSLSSTASSSLSTSAITTTTTTTTSSSSVSTPSSSAHTPHASHKFNPLADGEHRSKSHSLSNHHEGASISSDELKETISSLNLTPDQWQIDPNQLEYTLKLGAGASGKVYKGLYKGKEVAVKVLKNLQTQEQVDEFKKEFQIMCAIRSPFMVTFYGAALEPKLCMVMEFCSRDSLYHVMNSNKYEIGWEKFFKFALQMTRGMEVLHNWKPQIVHRDFKSLNLLVNEAWDCKVADFGLSRFNTAENMETLSKMRGTYAYCAPELATSTHPYTVLSDVYSIGIVIWELTARTMMGEYQRPFSEYEHIKLDFQIMLNSKEGTRPTMPPSSPESLITLYKECVSQEPSGRPTTTEIIRRLVEIEQDYIAHPAEWDARRKRGAAAAPAAAPASPAT